MNIKTWIKQNGFWIMIALILLTLAILAFRVDYSKNTPDTPKNAIEGQNLSGNLNINAPIQKVSLNARFIQTEQHALFEDFVLNGTELDRYNGIENDFYEYLGLKFELCQAFNDGICIYEVNGKLDVIGMIESVNNQIIQKVNSPELYAQF